MTLVSPLSLFVFGDTDYINTEIQRNCIIAQNTRKTTGKIIIKDKYKDMDSNFW